MSIEKIYPRNSTEERLFNIWKAIPNLIEFGVTDNFFDVGGNSLKSMSLITKINAEFVSNYTILNLFIYPNIRLFAEHIQTSDIVQVLQEPTVQRTIERMEETLRLLNTKIDE